MDATVDPSNVLTELARLLNLWAAHQWRETTVDTLVAWAEGTASLTPRPPSPGHAIPLLLQLNLAVADTSGNIRASGLVMLAGGAPDERLDRLDRPLALLTFDSLLSDPEFGDPLLEALAYVRPRGDRLCATWASVPDAERGNNAWLWLQQLGLAIHTGEELYLDEALRHHVLCLPVGKRPLSAAELEARLAAQKERAALAEEHIVEMEKQRLILLGAEEYVDGVVRISIENVEAGYDVLSYEVDGVHRHIEVKSSVGPRRFFILTPNEHEMAVRTGDTYWLAWVGYAERLPIGPCEAAWFRNPATIISATESPWRVDAAASRITVIADDSAHQWHCGIRNRGPDKSGPTRPGSDR
jgi:hypothetical protein